MIGPADFILSLKDLLDLDESFLLEIDEGIEQLVVVGLVEIADMADAEDGVLHFAAVRADPDAVFILECREDLVGIAVQRMHGCHAVGR